MKEGLTRWLEYVVYAHPYYNRSRGRDHVIVSNFENGPLCDCTMRSAYANATFSFDVIMSMVKIGYWAHHDATMFGWKPGYDIAMPQFGAVPDSFGPFPPAGPPPTWQQIVSVPKFSFGFSGSYWGNRVTCPESLKGAPPGSLGAKHPCECSPGTRTWLMSYMRTHCNATLPSRCAGLTSHMGSFWYALCPAAWACWSSRLYHAIDRGVVPVLMANGAIQPFEDLIDWRSFAVSLDTSQLLRNNVSQLEQLHHDALATSRVCTSCAECHNCTRLPLVRRVRQLEAVRGWFLYNGTPPNNAVGLLLVELHCRQMSRHGGGDGVCLRYHPRQATVQRGLGPSYWD